MKQIFFNLGTEMTVFVRYNPDTYKARPGERQAIENKRQEYLMKYIDELMKGERKPGLYVAYQFFDGFTRKESVELRRLDPYAE
jgi:hypothetical protein